MNKNWIIGLVLMLALTGTVLADSNNSTNSTSTNSTDDDSDTQGRALEVRYEHLQCKVEFTNGQIELLDKYVETDFSGLEDSSDTLNDYLDVLENYAEDNNKTAFDKYLEETFRPKFNNVTKELNSAKNNFRQYNISNSTKTEFIDDLKELQREYSDCVSDKEFKMGQVMEKHMKNWNKHYENNIKKMSRNGLNTTEMEAIMANITARNTELQRLIEAGNITKLKEFMEQFREESMYFATKMEIEKLRSYKDGLNAESRKYNKTDKIQGIDKQLEDAEKYSERRQGKYDDDQDEKDYSDDEDDDQDEEDYKGAWNNISGANTDMKELSKEILREREREHAEEGYRSGSGRDMDDDAEEEDD